MPEYDGLSAYLKAAARRLADAEELLEPPSRHPSDAGADSRHLLGASYLVGYAVECMLKAYIIMLKAYIITREPPARSLSQAVAQRQGRGEVVPNILGDAGHNLDTLLRLTDLPAALATDRGTLRAWTVCLKWKASWRYSPDSPRREDAEVLVASARQLHEWVRRRL